jgi:Ca2+-transporting ATPase
VGNVFLILATLSKSRYFYEVFFERNYAILVIISAAMVMLFAAISVPPLVHLFSFTYPGYWHFLPALCGAGVLLLVLEGVKFYKNK